jgi:hypothetical protein
VLHGHERSADAHDRVLGEPKNLVACMLGVAERHLDADLVNRPGVEACVAELAQQPVAIGDACGFDLNNFRVFHGGDLPAWIPVETR